jgi:integrase
MPVPRFVLEQLAEAIDGRAPSAHVFVGRRGADVLRNRIFRRHFLSEATAEIGLPGLTPHELRHTCASLAVRPARTSKRCRECWATPRLQSHWTCTPTSSTVVLTPFQPLSMSRFFVLMLPKRCH